MIADIMKDLQNMLFGSAIKVSFNSLPIQNQPLQNPSANSNNQPPKTMPVHTKSLGSANNERYLRKTENVVEPEANVVKGEDFAEVELEIPGVESLDDIYVTLHDESAEIRAYTKDGKTMYFKVVEIPYYADIVDRLLSKGKLILRFEVFEESYEDSQQ